MTAQSKGRRLGIYTPSSDEEREKLRKKREGIGAETVEMMDRAIPCVRTRKGLRALSGASPAEPESVRKYLAGRFQENLPWVETKLVELAATFNAAELDREAMNIYMRLRPNVPKGRQGWGRAGLLDTDKLDALIRKRSGQPRPGGSKS